jgi:hypothetical protein
MKRVLMLVSIVVAVDFLGMLAARIGPWLRAGESDARVSDVEASQTILFYPTLARQSADGHSWTVPIHGCVFEPETDSVKRTLLAAAIRTAMGSEIDAKDAGTFDARLRLFLVDHKRGKTVWVRVGDQVHQIGTSGPDGHFQGELQLSAAEVEALSRAGQIEDHWLAFQATLGPKDHRRLLGRVLLPPRTGLSVVSDIDDTIKITEVRDRRAMLANTFARPFRAVPDMAGMYRRLAAADATLHYVTGGPWQLYEPLTDFCRAENFPRGTFHMKLFRLTDSSALKLLGSQEEYKTPILKDLLAAMPERRFVLVGDSGEQDPEIYGRIARSNGPQVAAIFIRNVTGEKSDNQRFRKAFDGVPTDRWRLFDKPAELEPLVSRLIEARAAEKQGK